MIRLFWKHFFALLLAFIAVAEWACGAWLAVHLAGAEIPGFLHVAGPLIVYGINRTIVRRPLPEAPLALQLRRAYTAVAFTSVFGLIALLLVGLGWTVARAGLYVAGVQAAHPAVGLLGEGARVAASTGILGVAGAMAYAYARGASRLWVNRLEVDVADLPASGEGLLIAQISDVHAGAFLSPDLLADYVTRVNQLGPDLIVITGDLADSAEWAGRLFPVLDGLEAPLGVYAILGNHDRAAGEAAIAAALERTTSIRLLLDEVVELPGAGKGIFVAGVRDRGRDWARGVRRCPALPALAEQIPAGAPWILLSHRPDLFDQARALGASLVLAGHTHGGQLAIPLPGATPLNLARFMTRYSRGTYRSGGCTLHVNLGLGVTGQPARLATPREITLIRLRAAARTGEGARAGT